MITVTGKVYDQGTGDALPSATIAVNGKVVGAAGADGSFTVLLDNYGDNITVSSVGYDPVTLPASEVAASGTIGLTLGDDTLPAAVVTASGKKPSTWFWALAGIAVVASTEKSPSRRVSGRGSSNLLPLAALGVGAYLLLKPSTPVYSPYPGTGQYPGGVATNQPGGSVFTSGNISSIFDGLKDLFGSWNTSSKNENTPAGNYSSYDPPYGGGNGGIMAGTSIGATTTVNAGDILNHTLMAAMRVPVYDVPRDDAQPSGYINAGQPVGLVYSYLSPDPSQGRSELWWMFEPLAGNSEIGNDQGYYFTKHNPDSFNFQALADSGVLTVAQATALKNGTAPSTAEKLLDKYLPWLIGGIVAIGIGKAVINKVI
jgi:hypothetical protein